MIAQAVPTVTATEDIYIRCTAMPQPLVRGQGINKLQRMCDKHKTAKVISDNLSR